ncbi:MAG: Two-component system histidine kinase DccS [uncultured Sulfurovum sp.]|uniref:histidine kinase n=1 Tax=uncultured Sulfurovum sp. TaxID=269237 RepID=A0A6S6TA23_9BACT|nr:MAG: Two-component system histidine kinase DccS [uncultured Sulfurovum sp.]
MPSLQFEVWVMYLIKEERRTLFQFLLLYLGSSFILFAVIAYLFYQSESKAFYEKTRNIMQMNASVLSSKIIHAHMSSEVFSLEEVVQNYQGKIGFYDKDNKPLSSSINVNIDFTKKLYQDEVNMILVDQSTFGHLGVKSIVIEKEGIQNHMISLGYEMVFYLLFVYICIAIVGYFLAKLFIKPIQQKRIQLDSFIKDSTHELNTPITALMLSVNAPKLDSPKNLERIKLSAIRVSEIHKDLTYLMLERAEEKVVEVLHLNEILREQLKYLSLLAEKKKITIDLHAEDEIYFKIDKESFIRLIHNLVHNAIKYNKLNGSIEITVVDNVIMIKDTGMGISKKDQVAIYERFYRASSQIGGFGLGLNIVDKVCKAYSININLESKVDQGTTFILKF